MNLEAGDVFTAEIKRVIAGGLGVVKRGHDTITVGPVNCEEGTLVQLKYLGEEQHNKNTDVKYAICLTEDAIADGYDEYIQNRVNDLIPDEPPSQNEVTYTEIDEIDDQGIGFSDMGGTRICLGPVNAERGDIVKIEGVTDSCAKVVTSDYQGENYEVRFNILSKQFDKVSISIGEEFTTAITEVNNGTPMGYIADVPITFPNADAAIGQKIDGRITDYSHDKAIGDIVEKYDEVVRVENAGHWARVQWLRQQGFGDQPMQNFAAEFLDVDPATVPESEDRIRDMLVAEAIRLGLQDKAAHDTNTYPRAHVTGIRHWTLHKLKSILGPPTEEDDWFRGVLTDRTGPTLTFHGDLLELSHGYYAAGPTRAIMVADTEAVLVSGRPSRHFLDQGFNVVFHGISRILTDTTEAALTEAGIEVQSQADYIDAGDIEAFDAAYLQQFLDMHDPQPWEPAGDWEAYRGNTGYGFDWGDDPYEVTIDDGSTLSLWKSPVEYGRDEYWLKITPDDDRADPMMVQVPYRYQKQVCLVLDHIGGLSRRAELTALDDGIRLSCDFPPARPQIRWLNAIGAQWEQPKHNKIHWKLDEKHKESVKQAFSKIAVKIEDAARPATS